MDDPIARIRFVHTILSDSVFILHKRNTVTRTVSLCHLQGRQDSNLQPTVLETATLPIELRP
jgi:hypothetical protein